MNLTESHGVFVRIRAGLDVVSSSAIWEFQTIDPVTGKQYMRVLARLYTHKPLYIYKMTQH